MLAGDDQPQDGLPALLLPPPAPRGADQRGPDGRRSRRPRRAASCRTCSAYAEVQAPARERRAAPTRSSLRDRALLEVMYGCGLRASEAIGLEIGDVDLRRGFVRPHGKGSKERIVPLGREAARAVERYLRAGRPRAGRRAAGVASCSSTSAAARSPARASTRSSSATPRTSGSTGKMSPHTLRHTFATHLLVGRLRPALGAGDARPRRRRRRPSSTRTSRASGSRRSTSRRTRGPPLPEPAAAGCLESGACRSCPRSRRSAASSSREIAGARIADVAGARRALDAARVARRGRGSARGPDDRGVGAARQVPAARLEAARTLVDAPADDRQPACSMRRRRRSPAASAGAVASSTSGRRAAVHRRAPFRARPSCSTTPSWTPYFAARLGVEPLSDAADGGGALPPGRRAPGAAEVLPAQPDWASPGSGTSTPTRRFTGPSSTRSRPPGSMKPEDCERLRGGIVEALEAGLAKRRRVDRRLPRRARRAGRDAGRVPGPHPRGQALPALRRPRSGGSWSAGAPPTSARPASGGCGAGPAPRRARATA